MKLSINEVKLVWLTKKIWKKIWDKLNHQTKVFKAVFPTVCSYCDRHLFKTNLWALDIRDSRIFKIERERILINFPSLLRSKIKFSLPYCYIRHHFLTKRRLGFREDIKPPLYTRIAPTLLRFRAVRKGKIKILIIFSAT